MFEELVEEAPNVIKPHFSLLYPNLHHVNKVVTTKKENSSVFVRLCRTDIPDGWTNGSVCEGWWESDQRLGGNPATITLVHLVK